MSETKEFTEQTKRKVVKVGVIMQYGTASAIHIMNALKSENTLEKLQQIPNIIKDEGGNMTDEQKLFVIQKLLAYPKSSRISIANQIQKRLDAEIKED